MMKSQLQGRPSSASDREAELSAQLAEVSLSTTLPPLENRAAQSASPYVRSHASSPVAWQLLDDDAVQRAKKENKLIYIHIGFKSCYSTCANPKSPPPPPALPAMPSLTSGTLNSID